MGGSVDASGSRSARRSRGAFRIVASTRSEWCTSAPLNGQRVSEHRRRSERIALIGIGRISHWPASPDSGKIDEAFDRALVNRWSRNDRSAMLAYTDEQIYREAGAGAFGIRAWIPVAATARGRGELWHYAAYLFTPLLCRSLI
jgi:hypothetical protein